MKKHRMGKLWKGRIWTGSAAAAFIAAVVIFIFMLQAEKKALSEYERAEVCVAVSAIPRGEELTVNKVENYVEIKTVEKSLLSPNAVTDLTSVIGKTPVYTIEEGTLLTGGMLEDMETVTGEMEEPVIAGFRAEDLYQVAGGVLRAGDRIHIYCVDKGEKETANRLIWKNLVVQQVFDQNGNVISGEENTTPAQRINVYMDSTQAAEFYEKLAKGSLRAVKICR